MRGWKKNNEDEKNVGTEEREKEESKEIPPRPPYRDRRPFHADRFSSIDFDDDVELSRGEFRTEKKSAHEPSSF